jgi:GNAT superfamily N-acetyltransferase
METRPATLADASAIAELTTELGYPVAAPAITERLAMLAGGGSDVVLVAVEDGVVAGWIQAHTLTSLETGLRMELVGLIVAARFRRRGVGRLLVAAAESWGRARGIDVFSVRSNVQRVESHAFYPALGYEKTKTQAAYRKRVPRDETALENRS